jgi:chromosomal replication initiation ATPase DnaA
MKLGLDTIVRLVAHHYRCHPDALAGPVKLTRVVKARQVAMHLARRRGFKLAEIGAALGGRQQSTVTRADAKIAAARLFDPALDRGLVKLERLIDAGAPSPTIHQEHRHGQAA